MSKEESVRHTARTAIARIVIYVEGGVVQSVLSDTPPIVIYVEGGVVQSVLSDTPRVTAMIVDYDNEKAGDDRASRSFELVEVNQPYIQITIQGTEE